MCGIVGYIGPQQAVPILLDGLEKLEYRGYDSAGIAVFDGEKLDVSKRKGRLSVLKELLNADCPSGNLGIGHTRWATHGAPADVNAHPHTNRNGDIAIVHNGIIENYAKIKEWLSMRGYSFRSQTDTEVVAHLIDYYYTGDLLEAVSNACQRLTGAYALCVVCSYNPDEIIAVRKDSPLVIGVGQGENFIASDVPALLKHTRSVYFLEDGELARVTRDSVEITDSYGMPVFKEVFKVDWTMEAAEKGGYPHFMLKEIHEEPKAIYDTVASRLGAGGLLDLAGKGITQELAQALKRVVIIACGTSYHAAMIGKYMLEKALKIPVEVDIASEYRYRNPPIFKDDLFIVISQSGETADTLAAMRLARSRGANVLAITNVEGSTISRESDAVMYTIAGPEIAVASTKAYSTQIICLVMLVMELGRMRGDINSNEYETLLEAIRALPNEAKKILESQQAIKNAAHRFSTVSDAYFMGRNLDYAVSLEASLKLKEISYIHSEAFAAGELKHGPIALIEEGTLVVVIATQSELYEKIASNIKEVKARGAHVLAICPSQADLVRDIADDIIDIPQVHELLMPIMAVIPTQLFAYYCAVERGFDVDKPRNLAKSVTVE